MSKHFPGNPWADAKNRVDLNTAGVMVALNILSFEQRTANLIAYARHIDGTDHAVLKTIAQRLGFREGTE